MNKRKQEVWNEILSSSAKMSEVAERNDWSLLEELVQERKKLLSEFFSEPIAKDKHLALDQIRQDISQILAHDGNTQSSCESHNKAILGSLQKRQKGRSALKMYN